MFGIAGRVVRAHVNDCGIEQCSAWAAVGRASDEWRETGQRCRHSVIVLAWALPGTCRRSTRPGIQILNGPLATPFQGVMR